MDAYLRRRRKRQVLDPVPVNEHGNTEAEQKIIDKTKIQEPTPVDERGEPLETGSSIIDITTTGETKDGIRKKEDESMSEFVKRANEES